MMATSATMAAENQATYQFSMERVLFNLHHKCCTFAINNTTRRSRSFAEHFVLIAGLCSFGALFLVHSKFVHPSGLRSTCLPSIPDFVKDSDLTHIRITNEATSRVVKSQPSRQCSSLNAVSTELGIVDSSSCRASAAVNATEDSLDFSFAREKAYLLFSPELVQKHAIRVQNVLVSKRDENCFGDPFLQYLVYYLNGYDTVMVNWLIGTYSSENGKRHTISNSNEGFIYNHRTREPPTDIRISSHKLFGNEISRLTKMGGEQSSNRFLKWFFRKLESLLVKGAVVIKTSFLFFITTKLVSFTLRETQGRMLDFTHHLQECFRDNRPVVQLVTTHVVENLVFVPVMVGMIFFLIKFYRGDMFLAFLVLSLVWVCESLSLVG
jgi:Tumour-associated protein